MLKHRLLTAAVLIILVITGTLYLPKIPFAIAFGLFCQIGLWEWAGLARCHHLFARSLYLLGNAALMVEVYFLPA